MAYTAPDLGLYFSFLQRRLWQAQMASEFNFDPNDFAIFPAVIESTNNINIPGGLQDAAEAFKESGCHGVIATNTTLARPAGIEFEGGLSGRPLAARAQDVLAELRRLLPETPLVSVGGIDSAAEARARLDAGADLIQIYTGMVYEGPGLIARILKEL